jgi:hypothetical protein
MAKIFKEFDIERVDDFFASADVRFILVHLDLLTDERGSKILNYLDSRKRVQFVRQFGTDYLYRMK